MEQEKIKQIIFVDKTEHENLLNKYPAIKGTIEKEIESWCNYYNKKPFNEKYLIKFLNCIKESITFVNETIEEKQQEDNSNECQLTYFDAKGNERVSIPNVTYTIMKQFSFKTIFDSKNETIYVFEEGIYTPKGKEIIKQETEELLQSKCTNHIVIEVMEKIKRRTIISNEQFDKVPEELICLENGILNVKTQELFNHSPNYPFKSKLPIYFNPHEKCLDTNTFFEEILYPEDIPVIQEWIGFCLYKKYFIKKAIILFGEKNTGKTVLLNLLMFFLGYKNTSGINLQRISSGDKFAIASLKNKMANVFDDLSAKDLTDSGGFKIATGGGYMTGEHKFGDPFQFINYAKHIFATNNIPDVKDINDDAYYERWIPIQLDNQVEESKKDNFLIEKLTTKEELSGLLNWSLEGLKRLLEKGNFSFNKKSKEIKQIMQRQNNPLVAFANDCLIQDDGNKISKEDMYINYCVYCTTKKLPKLSKNQLGRNLLKFVPYMNEVREKVRYWNNVRVENKDILDTFFKFKGKVK